MIRELRLSLTDRCNFRCLYCRPAPGAALETFPASPVGPAASAPREPPGLRRASLLSLKEIERVARLVVGLGVRKLRLTGGEPLLRPDLEELVRRLAPLPGLADLAMTTNGFLFRARARALRQAGLRRVTFSLDTLDPATFRRLTGRDGLAEVLAGIRLARDLGFESVKVNAVIIRGLNDHELEALAEFARRQHLCLRFIEFMPLDAARAWAPARVVSGGEMLARLQTRFALVPVAPERPSATARRWRFAEGAGELGIIAPLTEPFCRRCNRLRLTADGQIRTCLFSRTAHDLRALLRLGATEAGMAAWLRTVVWRKEQGHSIGAPDFEPPNLSSHGG